MAVWLNKDPAVVALLLEAGADVTAKLKRGELALDLAVTTNPDAASLLLKALAKSGLWKEHGITPLHEAALFARASDVSSLLKGGADPNARYWDGSGPLHWSVYLRSAQPDKTLAVVAALMEAGADPRASNNYGYTPAASGRVQREPGPCRRFGKGRRRSERAGTRTAGPAAFV